MYSDIINEDTHLVLSSGHALVDLFELSVVRPQELEWLGDRGHGRGGGTNLPTQLLKRRVMKRHILLL